MRHHSGVTRYIRGSGCTGSRHARLRATALSLASSARGGAVESRRGREFLVCTLFAGVHFTSRERCQWASVSKEWSCQCPRSRQDPPLCEGTVSSTLQSLGPKISPTILAREWNFSLTKTLTILPVPSRDDHLSPCSISPLFFETWETNRRIKDLSAMKSDFETRSGWKWEEGWKIWKRIWCKRERQSRGGIDGRDRKKSSRRLKIDCIVVPACNYSARKSRNSQFSADCRLSFERRREAWTGEESLEPLEGRWTPRFVWKPYHSRDSETRGSPVWFMRLGRAVRFKELGSFDSGRWRERQTRGQKDRGKRSSILQSG